MQENSRFPDPPDEEWATWNNRQKRAWLAERFLWEARDLLDAMHQPYKVIGFTNGKALRVRLEEPPTGDKRNLTVAAAVCVDKSLLLEKHDSGDSGVALVEQWVRGLLGTGETPG